MPAPTLASDEPPAPSRVRTVDFSASAFDFMIVAAIWLCVPPAFMARRLLTILIISIRNTPNAGTLPRRWLTLRVPDAVQRFFSAAPQSRDPRTAECNLQWRPDPQRTAGPCAASGGRRLSSARRDRLAAAIVVEAALGLAAEPAG